ncbi:putative transcription factor MYB58 [Camellia lanceoleosa]|uniref:Transcription factor MYB58 n=1 Tax=Camellia lanceoleosa TaxID=1840588 RepID=A0ACC0HYL9_9ERIC|nr:putative transcription factor MYB58 [Camellia lanceoleosa]
MERHKSEEMIKKGPWTVEEDEVLVKFVNKVVIETQARFGNKWAAIASHLQGRIDNDVMNFWSSRKKRLARILQSTSPL